MTEIVPKAKRKGKRPPPPKPNETISDAVQKFLNAHPPPCDLEKLLSTLPKRWSLYPPLVLLPPSAFNSAEWQTYLNSLPESQRNEFFRIWTTTLKASHLAINAPIQDNLIRSPQITPLLGAFGKFISIPPTQQDFNKAFWVTTTQNGIKQTWAPLYTMFSRGNISEKARILDFPDIKGEEVGDLFVGIGYFAFSYLKAGAKRVWGWDLNPWSVEALRRGAEMNGWRCMVDSIDDDAEIVVFNEDNKMSVGQLNKIGVKVKHVNLGLLPSSECAWKIAAEILDEEGGWIHVHGNCRDSEIEVWKGEILKAFTELFNCKRQGKVERTFRVKEFGPGVGHYVLDLGCSSIRGM